MSKYQKISLLTLVLILMSLLLTGCLEGSIALEVSPNPVVFSLEEPTQEITISARTSGFGSLTVDDITVLIYENDDEGEELYQEVIEVNEEAPFVVSGIEFEESEVISLEDIFSEMKELSEEQAAHYYTDEIEGRTLTLKLILDGSSPTETSASILFE